MHFQKLFPFLKYFHRKDSDIKRFNSSTTTLIAATLVKKLAIPEIVAMEIVKRAKLNSKPADMIKEALSTLQALGYHKEEILSFPNILKMRPRRIVEVRSFLYEAGFSNLSVKAIASHRSLLNKKISYLKSAKHIAPHVNVPETLIMYLQPKPLDFDIDHFTEEDILGKIHCSIVKRYLQWKLEATSDEIERFWRIYSNMMKYKSLRDLCENLEIALDLGFTPRRLLGFGYLLGNDPNIPKEILRKMPNFAGANMRIMLRRFPKLMTVQPKQFHKIYEILQKENIPDSTMQKQMNIFTLSVDTIKSRFDDIRNTPEMMVLKQSPRILRLIIHYHRAKSRLSFMHQLQLKCTTMCLLENDHDHYFNSYVRNTKDTNVLNDVLRLLRHLLKSDAPDLEYNFRKHPYHLHVPMVDIERTCKYVQKAFSNSAIIKVAPIVLYPSEKIETALREIKSMTDLPQARLTEAKKLNLALYLMEKEHHFTGDGVWEVPAEK